MSSHVHMLLTVAPSREAVNPPKATSLASVNIMVQASGTRSCIDMVSI